MKITISSLGRFWAFDLACQMLRLRAAMRLYTAYPLWKVDPTLRPFTRSSSWMFLAATAAQRIGWSPVSRRLNRLAITRFDRWVSHRIEACDLFVHLSSFGLSAAHRAKELGAKVVCDRGSSHILFQQRLLKEEYARHGLSYQGTDSRIVDRELQEYQQADCLTVPSTFACRSFVQEGLPREKIRILPYGVDLALFRPMRKEDERFRVLFVGSYSLRKGMGYLFEAMRPLVKGKAAELWLVGNPTQEAQGVLRKNADCFIDQGSHPRARLAQLYSQGSVLVLPSIEDGFGLVMAQAMACGVPVIATENTGAEDLFTDGKEGFIVPIRDPAAIRRRIQWMLDDPRGRQAMAQAALRRVRQLGGWETYGEQALAIYTKLRNGSSGALHG